jgi:hypothetical protein
MLRDRFKTWNAQPKYNRRQPPQPRRRKQAARGLAANQAVDFGVSVSVQVRRNIEPNVFIAHPATETRIDDVGDHDRRASEIRACPDFEAVEAPILLNVVNPFMSPEPSRTPDTPQEDWHLQKTLKEIEGYLDRIVEQGSWIYRHEEPAFALQKLAANAHLAISSQSYDCHAIWKELDELYSPVCKTMPRFDENNLLTMHPRALVVLLRLLVDSLSIDIWASQTLEHVKYMFWIVTSQTLPARHPVRLLCGMPKRNTKQLLFRFLELMDVRLFAKVSGQQPDGPTFVAQEQTYVARVLSSLGYTQWAEFKLRSVIGDLDSHMDPFTKADALRTQGYCLEQSSAAVTSDRTKSVLQQAKVVTTSALDLFLEIGMRCSNEVMFTRISLAQASRKLGEFALAETHLTEAIYIWEQTRQSEDQGGVKLILDLHQVMVKQEKLEEARELRQMHPRYFEESRIYL